MLNDLSFHLMGQGNTVHIIDQHRVSFFQNEIVVLVHIHGLSGLYINGESPCFLINYWMIVCNYKTSLESDHLNL